MRGHPARARGKLGWEPKLSQVLAPGALGFPCTGGAGPQEDQGQVCVPIRPGQRS